ncbi:MAG TPA: hypothetical protein V6D22_12605 [Candidatus Obscuribacterales bacterium]
MTSFSSPSVINAVSSQPRLTELEEIWLIFRYPFLTAAAFTAAVEMEMDAANRTANASAERTAEDTLRQYQFVRERIISIGYNQMDALASVAMEDSEDGALARKVICSILLSDREMPAEVKDHSMAVGARTLLAISSQIESADAREIFGVLAVCLSRRIQLPDSVRTDLLNAFANLAEMIPEEGKAQQFSDVCGVLNEALMLELVRPAEMQSVPYCRRLLSLMHTYYDSSTRAILQQISELHPELAIRQAASELLGTIATGLQDRWEQAQVDQLATPLERAQRMADAFRAGQDPDILTQSIFNNMKGAPLSSAQDKRVYTIRKFLMHADVRVRLAMCWAVLAEVEYSLRLENQVGCLDVLADIAVNSRSPKLSNEAVAMIRRLQDKYPALQRRIEKACDTATAEFLRVQSEADARRDPSDSGGP